MKSAHWYDIILANRYQSDFILIVRFPREVCASLHKDLFPFYVHLQVYVMILFKITLYATLYDNRTTRAHILEVALIASPEISKTWCHGRGGVPMYRSVDLLDEIYGN